MLFGRIRRLGPKDAGGGIVFEGAIGYWGHQHPVIGTCVSEVLLELAVIGLVLIIEAEVSAGMEGGISGEEYLPLIAHDEGLVIDEQLTRQAKKQEYRENHKAIITALDLAKAAQLLGSLRVQFDQTHADTLIESNARIDQRYEDVGEDIADQ